MSTILSNGLLNGGDKLRTRREPFMIHTSFLQHQPQLAITEEVHFQVYKRCEDLQEIQKWKLSLDLQETGKWVTDTKESLGWKDQWH